MAPSNSQEAQQNTYVFSTETIAEMNRLKMQNQFITEAMGGQNGHLPEFSDLSRFRRILDLGCGPGDWLQDLAYAHPEIEFVGVDINQQMIEYANARKTQNIVFQVMNITEPLDFPSNSFDLVNSRLISFAITKPVWPHLAQEGMRILKPGGIMRMTESESPITNSRATERFADLLRRALQKADQIFSPDGQHVGITYMLGSFLQKAGFQNIRHRSFSLDFSAGTSAHDAMYENTRMAYLLAQPFMLRMGAATQQELTEVYNDTMREMQEPDFRALWQFMVVWGEKPTEEQ